MPKIRKTGKGLYTEQFTVDGKRYTVYGKTKKECQEKELAKRKEIEEGRNTRGGEQTLDHYFEIWITAKAGSVKEYTLRTNQLRYKAISSAVIGKKAFGTFKLKDIESGDIVKLQGELKKAGQSTATINASIQLLRSILESAVSERILTWNPAKSKNVRPKKRTEEKAADTIHRALTKEETELFLKTAEEDGSWYLNLYRFLLHTGCRIGEAGAFTRADILTEKGKIFLQVSRTITRTETGGFTIGDSPKTKAGKRAIAFDDEAMSAIKNQQRINGQLQEGCKFETGQPIFKSPEGMLLSSSVINSDIRRICKKAGMERFTCHAFRDTFATRKADEGMRPDVLMEVMGHSNINITYGYYVHITNETIAKEMKAANFR